MDLLIAVGVMVSFTYSALSMVLCLFMPTMKCSTLFETATSLVLSAKIGKYLEMKARERCAEHLRDLETVFPSTHLL